MRATLEMNPYSGPGYAILRLHDMGEAALAQPMLKRLSDGLYLGSGGWQMAPAELFTERQERRGGDLLLFLSPAWTDNLAANQEYLVEIPGFGNFPLNIQALLQSHAAARAGSEFYPGPQDPQKPPLSPGRWTDAAAVPNLIPEKNRPSDKKSEQGNPAEKSPRGKRGGCLFLALFGIAIWLAGAWLLWHGSMAGADIQQARASSEQPEEEERDSRPFFEIIPASPESSFVEDDEGQPMKKDK